MHVTAAALWRVFVSFVIALQKTGVAGCIEGLINMDEFDYTAFSGPEGWHRRWSTCGGNRQSPILLDKCSKSSGASDIIFSGHADYRPSGFRIHNVFQTLEFQYPYTDAPPIIHGGPLPQLNFALAQIHFHWGKAEDSVGSEHAFPNSSFVLEAHMVHYNTEYNSLVEAVNQQNGVLIVALLFQQTPYNVSEFSSVVDNLQFVSQGGTFKIIDGHGAAWLKQFTYDNKSKSKGYLTYTGSLTAPPCSEKVTWVVLQTIGLIGRKQVEEFRKLYGHAGVLDVNRRPFQPVNNRPVVCSE